MAPRYVPGRLPGSESGNTARRSPRRYAQGLETLWRGGCGVGAVESPIVVLEDKPLFMAGWAA
jgi:isoaspartyl peptidase/L-asparaginase-like protein (Ntn-hydrolase superfamily)